MKRFALILVLICSLVFAEESVKQPEVSPELTALIQRITPKTMPDSVRAEYTKLILARPINQREKDANALGSILGQKYGPYCIHKTVVSPEKISKLFEEYREKIKSEQGIDVEDDATFHILAIIPILKESKDWIALEKKIHNEAAKYGYLESNRITNTK